jgi:hypothetical protein
MILGKREPALIAGAITALVAVLIAHNVLEESQARAWETLALIVIPPLVQAFVTRQSVFSPATIERAGLSPEAVQERADDPQIPPYRPPQ